MTFYQDAPTLVVTKNYDFLNRLASIVSRPTTATSVTFAYRYNDSNQRVQVTLADGSFWAYDYDTLGHVQSGKHYWSDFTPVAGQQFEYRFDDVGNRTSTGNGGDDTGTVPLRTSTYLLNGRCLNQYDSRTISGGVDVIGIANAGANVSVGGQAAYRRGEYFRREVTIDNSSGPSYQSVTVSAVNGGSSSNLTGNVLLPGATEVYSFDEDGNQTSDGLWTYSWNAENQLVSIQSNANVPTAAKRLLNFEYDFRGRRISKTVYTTTDGLNYTNPTLTKYVYDGWNLVGEFDGNNNCIRLYYWGADLSGGLDGAGGIGGLLAVYSPAAAGTLYWPMFDGNGNVVAYTVSSATRIGSAQQEYGPFGEVIRATSSISPAIPIRWSTKYTDLETDLVYYGRRYYNPSTGRWLSRDPINDPGFKLLAGRKDDNLQQENNLYRFVGNDPVSETNPLGLCDIKIRCNPVVELGMTVGWHCGVIAPNGVQYDLGGVGIGGSSGGTPVVYPISPNPTPEPVETPTGMKDYPVSCGKCSSCDSVQKCIQNYHDTVVPQKYFALGPNSNTYAHNMLNACGCSVDPIQPPCYMVLRAPKQGGPYLYCPPVTTTPPGAVAWNYGF